MMKNAFIIALLFTALGIGSARACEVVDPYGWSTDTPCPPAAESLIRRMSDCLGLLNRDTNTKKDKAFVDSSSKQLRCDYVLCDYDAAPLLDREVTKEYVERQFTDENEFRLTFANACKKPAPILTTKSKTPVTTTKGNVVGTTPAAVKPAPAKPVMAKPPLAKPVTKKPAAPAMKPAKTSVKHATKPAKPAKKAAKKAPVDKKSKVIKPAASNKGKSAAKTKPIAKAKTMTKPTVKKKKKSSTVNTKKKSGE